MQTTEVDQTVLHLWTEERHRLFALETGQIEDPYRLDIGVTELLISEGPENARAIHTIDGRLDDETLKGLLKDQRMAMEMVFDSVKGEKPLSESVIKGWHALLTRHQATAPGRDVFGRRKKIRLIKGAYKSRSNNPENPTGEYTNTVPRNTCHWKWSD